MWRIWSLGVLVDYQNKCCELVECPLLIGLTTMVDYQNIHCRSLLRLPEYSLSETAETLWGVMEAECYGLCCSPCPFPYKYATCAYA